MASLLRKKSGYILRWVDRKRTPTYVAESLKTTEHDRALYLKRKLEYEYLEGKHDPWIRKWYDRAADPTSATLKQAADWYLSDRSKEKGRKSWTPATYRQNKGVLSRFCDLIGPDVPAPQLSEMHLQKWYDRPGDRSDHTTAFEQRILRAFCRWMHKQDIISKMVDAEINRPQETLPEYLTETELIQIYDYKQEHIERNRKYSHSGISDWHIDAWKLAASTGMRKAEIGSLKLNAIRDDTIIVGYQHRTKSGKQRAVPIMFEADEVLEKYLDPEYRAGDPVLLKSDLIFGRKQGIDRMARSFTDCCRALWPDRKELTLHSLRHTFAVRYLTAPGSEGRDFRLVKLQMILGHSDISTTMKYLKIDTSRLQF